MQSAPQRVLPMRASPGPSPCGLRRQRLGTRTEASHQQSGVNTERKRIFIFGLGYTSVALGNWLAADGWSVSGTCRTLARVEGLRARGWEVGVYDPARAVGLSPALHDALERSPFVLSSVPPLGLALYDPALAAQKALLRPLAAAGRVSWFGYLSSTGVYGDWQGEWVDESAPCRQTSSRAIVRQEAEAAWIQMYEQHGLPVHIFRLGGIYGPGRSVLGSIDAQPGQLSSSQRRRGVQRYTARCHVRDIAGVLAASMRAPRPGAVYNVVDDEPAPRGEVADFARGLLLGAAAAKGAPAAAAEALGSAVTEASASAAAGASAGKQEVEDGAQALTGRQVELAWRGASGSSQGSREGQDGYAGSGGGGGGGGGGGDGVGDGGGGSRRRGASAPLEEKRVRNALIKSELGVELRFPSYREGVAAIHAGELWPLTAEDLKLL